MREPYGVRLGTAVAERGPLCVGIDPHPALLRLWGLEPDVVGLERCARGMVEALGGTVAVFKPQSAFFEAYGSAGVAVLERTLADIAATGALSLLDVKRGDIGSTTQAYADAYLDPASPLAADALTLSPFLGTGSLEPMVATARRHHAGLFVLALTSNPEAPQVQAAVTTAGPTVAGAVLAWLAGLNAADNAAADELGSFGAVVGATIGETSEDLAVGGPLLVPGVGAQGGTPDSVRRTFGAALPQVLPSSSREVLGAGPDPDALRAAARRAGDGFAALLGG